MNSKTTTSILFTAAAASAASVSPMITSSWSQSGNGYNDQVPEFNGQFAPTGCLSVAFGQVLRHFNYPKRGIGYVSYCNDGNIQCRDDTRVKADFYLTHYDWENMPDALGRFSTEEEKFAVSQLLAHVGASVHVKYAKDGSAAPLDNPMVFKGLSKHFNFNNADRKLREDYNALDWEDLIKNEILAGSPVVLTGTDSKVEAGHAYIVDGLREDGKVHLNVGWGGYANGWYDLDDIVIANKFRFTEGLQAYVGLRPTQHAEGGRCAGRFGEQCAEGLTCDVPAEAGEDAHGLCVSSSDNTGRTEPPLPPLLKDDTVTKSGNLESGEEVIFGPFASLDESIVTLQGTGDADLYIQLDTQPTLTDFICRPYKSSSNEECVIHDPASAFFVMVRGYKAADYTLEITTTGLA